MSDKQKLRVLSKRQASNCEQAREPVCHCRCGGALHGARRGDGDSFFESLPATDPHYTPSHEAKLKAKRDATAERTRKLIEEWGKAQKVEL